MNIFMQGMRRSGTTIVYDILSEDASLDCYYEPLAAANREAIGGGSGAKEDDVFVKIRRMRAEFMKRHPEVTDASMLNFGAPRDPKLEFEPELPAYALEYLRFLTQQASDTVVKFTRMYCKVKDLKELDPEAKFVHLVRNPRSVATSYLYGKDQRNKDKFKGEKFFTREDDYTAWSSGPFSDHILSMPEYRGLKHIKDFERILLVWKFNFIKTHYAGKALFGDNYCLFSHDDLVKNPIAGVESFYRFLGRPMPANVREWTQANVHYRPSIHEPESKHWQAALAKLGMEMELVELEKTALSGIKA
jgi:hypothetical protein